MGTASARAAADRTASSDGVAIAFRDHGGDGPPIILVPGAGRTLIDFEPMLPVLTGRHRVVSMDLRGHGLSADGEWTADALVEDVAAVAQACGLDGFAVAGHSLGGMIAALYGARRDGCLAAVNIDGHGQGKPEQYVGFTREEAVSRLAELRELGERSALPPADLTAEQLEAIKSAILARLAEAGVPADLAQRGFDRGVAALGEGRYRVRPSAAQQRALLALVEALDLFALYRTVRCPLLIYNATKFDDPPAGQGAPEWLGSLMRAYRAGLTRDLGALAAEHAAIQMREVDATHALILEQPETIAEQVSDFVLSASRVQ